MRAKEHRGWPLHIAQYQLILRSVAQPHAISSKACTLKLLLQTSSGVMGCTNATVWGRVLSRIQLGVSGFREEYRHMMRQVWFCDKASAFRPAVYSPILPAYMIATLAQLFHHHPHVAIALSLPCSHSNATFTQPYGCNTCPAFRSQFI